jgi:acyl dehydratase
MPSVPIEEPFMSVRVGGLTVGEEIAPVVKRLSIERMRQPLMAGGNPLHYDAEFAKNAGLPAPIATGVMSSAFLSEMLTNAFGVEWMRGGTMDVKFIRPIYADDVVTARGRITGKSETGPGIRVTLDIWCDVQGRGTVTVGTASVVIY